MSSAQPLSKALGRESLRGLIVAGDVVNNNDPDKLLRVRVRVPLLHRDIPDTKLPWSRPQMHLGPSGVGGGVGGIRVPAVGAKVMLQFNDDSLYNTSYVADFAYENSIPAELLADYPNSYGWIDAAGNLFFVNTITKEVRFIHVSGSKIEIAPDGELTIASATKVTVSGSTQVDVLAANKVSVHGGSLVDIRATEIHLNDSQSGTSPVTTTARTKPTGRNVAGNTKL